MLYTNNYHHLHYLSLTLDSSGPFPLADIKKGGWYYIDYAYKNIMILAGNILFFRMMIKTSGTLRLQAATMFLASLIPWIANILYMAGAGPRGIDINPFFLALTGPLFALALFRFKMFHIIPIARDRVFENMKDPVIVIDMTGKVADYNNAAEVLFPRLSGSKGEMLDIVLNDHSEIIELTDSFVNRYSEIEVTVKNEKSYYKTAAVPLNSRRGKNIGTIISLSDITTQKRLLKSLQKLATIDELTGLFNRRHFMTVSKKEITRSKRYRRPLALLIIDLDFFKKINDTYGHQAGDKLLVETAGVFKEKLRISDTPGRYGGEEFVVLLPETDAPGAERIALRVKDEIEALRVDYKKKVLRITASMGISSIDFLKKGNSEDLDQLLNRMLAEADRALYRAKNGGRNRVELFLRADNPVFNDQEPSGKKA